MARGLGEELVLDDRHLRVTNLGKVLYPAAGFTKAAVIDYYIRVGRVMLPHLHDRPVTLRRYPDGVNGETFFEKNCPAWRPAWMKTAEVWSHGKKRHTRFCVLNDLESLVWVANLAALELHPSLSVASDLDRPTALVFDLDPGAPADVIACAEVALLLKGLFDSLKVKAFPKTSGSKGLQVYVPLNTPVTYDETKAFARTVAEVLERHAPGLVVSSMKKELRQGKVFVDWSQNDAHKTTVAVYSLRALDRPTVSTPVTWDEVQTALKKKKPGLLRFETAEVLKRIERQGDLFAPVLRLKQKLPVKGHSSRNVTTPVSRS